MSNEKISVIIPVYNVEKYLPKCLDSLINQTYQNLEIICIDDGSTDTSPQILKEYAQKDSRIKIITSCNEGLSAARNKGLKQMTGVYVSFVDSDDWLDEKTYEKALSHFTKDVDSVCWFAALVPDTPNINITSDKKKYHDVNFKGKLHLDQNNFFELTVTVWNKIYRKSIIDKYKINFAVGLNHEDFSFFTKYMILAPDTYCINEYLYFYRQRENSITTVNAAKKLKYLTDGIKNFEHTYDFFRQIPLTLQQELILVKMFEICCRHDYAEAPKFAAKNVLKYANNLLPQIRFQGDYNLKEILKNISRKKLFKPGLKRRLRQRFLNPKNFIFKLCRTVLIQQFAEWQNEQKEFIADTIFSMKKILNNQADVEINIAANIKYQVDRQILESLKALDEFYFWPNFGNIGDVVIASAEYQLLDNNELRYKIYNNSLNFNINEQFDLVYGGGGLFVKHWNYQYVKEVFKSQNLRKAVILPASFFECDDLLEVLDERFIVFCREKRSYEYCKSKNTRAQFFLTNDMVFSLDLAQCKINNSNRALIKEQLEILSDEQFLFIHKERYQIYKALFKRIMSALNIITLEHNGLKLGYFLREDAEKAQHDAFYVPSIDLSSLLCSTSCDKGMVNILSKLFMCSIDCLDVIVTDRLHIGLCAALQNKKVCLLDNNYGKLSGIFEQTLKDFPNVKFFNNIDELKSELNSISGQSASKLMEYSDMLSFPEFLLEYLSIRQNLTKITELPL